MFVEQTLALPGSDKKYICFEPMSYINLLFLLPVRQGLLNIDVEYKILSLINYISKLYNGHFFEFIVTMVTI